MGAYVSLLEYNGIEGMILLSELSRRRIRSITKLIKVWAACVCVCWLGVDWLGVGWRQPQTQQLDGQLGSRASSGTTRWPPNVGCSCPTRHSPDTHAHVGRASPLLLSPPLLAAGGPARARHGAACGQGQGIHRPLEAVRVSHV
jgi:hypothetical protein